MTHNTRKDLNPFLRRDFLKAGSFGMALLLGGRQAIAANATSNVSAASLRGRILGLSTMSEGKGTEDNTSEIINLDLNTGEYVLTPLNNCTSSEPFGLEAA